MALFCQAVPIEEEVQFKLKRRCTSKLPGIFLKRKERGSLKLSSLKLGQSGEGRGEFLLG